jgi:hypothetical protein
MTTPILFADQVRGEMICGVLAVMFADYDPGTLTGFYAIVLTVGIVILLSIIAGLAYCLKAPRIGRGLLIAAGVSFFIGICVAVAVIWLSHKGVLHFL